MPSKKLAIETAAATPGRAAKPKASKTTIAVTSAAAPRVRSAKHKAATVAVEAPAVNAHNQIAQIAYGFWEARGRAHGHHEQDWLRAEQEYGLIA